MWGRKAKDWEYKTRSGSETEQSGTTQRFAPYLYQVFSTNHFLIKMLVETTHTPLVHRLYGYLRS